MSKCEHQWRTWRYSHPISDGYGHLFYAEMTRCDLCGKEKPASWKVRLFGWSLFLIIALLLFVICMGWAD